MNAWERFLAWRRRRRRLLAEAQEEALEREASRVRRVFAASTDAASEKTPVPDGVSVRWGLAEDEKRIAELLDLNGMPRWVAFENRFVVAEERGRIAAAVRYRTESQRLLLGLLAADPWQGERRLAVALYAGVGALARELGARRILAKAAGPATYPAEAGYTHGIGGWWLDPDRPVRQRSSASGAAGDRRELPGGTLRRMLALWGAAAVPFFRAFRE